MSAAVTALLAGLLLAPALLLWLGHGLRRRPRRWRAAFWGGVAGYAAGVALMLGAALLPPEGWPAANRGRGALVHGAVLAGTLAGMAVGAGRGRG